MAGTQSGGMVVVRDISSESHFHIYHRTDLTAQSPNMHLQTEALPSESTDLAHIDSHHIHCVWKYFLSLSNVQGDESV